jgi:hypothetical protein
MAQVTTGRGGLRRLCLAAICSLLWGPAQAQTAAEPPASPAAPPTAAAAPRIGAAAGTQVVIELTQRVSSNHNHRGDRFTLRLAEPVMVDGQVVLAAGLTGAGEVVEAAGAGFGGRPGKLVLAARYLNYDGRRLELRTLRLGGAGRNNRIVSQLAGIGTYGLGGLIVPGGNIAYPVGARATAKLAADFGDVTPQARSAPASVSPLPATADAAAAAATVTPPAAIAPPPPGKAQVVFFRPLSLSPDSALLGFPIREKKVSVAKIGVKSYQVYVADPGLHIFTIRSELGDSLRLELDAGETYYIKEVSSKGLVIGIPELILSDAAAFHKAGGTKLRPSKWTPAPAPPTPAQAGT